MEPICQRMKNKVVFLSCIDFNGSTAGSSRMHMYSKMLRAEGTEYEFYSIHDFYKNYKLIGKLTSRRHIRVISYPLRLLLYVSSINNFVTKDDNTIFYLYPTSSVLVDYFLILYLKLFKKQMLFLEVNEVRRFGQGIRPKTVTYFKYALHERLAKYFDGLVCISKNIETYYKKYNKNTLLIPILSNVDNQYKNNCNYQGDKIFNIGFTGSIHIEKENLAIFFAALSMTFKKGYPIVLNLYGPVSNENELYKLVDRYDLNSVVKYQGMVKQELLTNILAKQDLLVLPRAQSQQNQYGFSTKLAEYLVSGVPVLITDVSDNLVYLTPNKDCIVADYRNSTSFSAQIECLIINYNEVAEQLAEKAFISARKKFSYLVHSSNFRNFLGLSM